MFRALLLQAPRYACINNRGDSWRLCKLLGLHAGFLVRAGALAKPADGPCARSAGRRHISAGHAHRAADD